MRDAAEELAAARAFRGWGDGLSDRWAWSGAGQLSIPGLVSANGSAHGLPGVLDALESVAPDEVDADV